MIKFCKIWLGLLLCFSFANVSQAQFMPSFADLVDKLQPSVVNISTTKNQLYSEIDGGLEKPTSSSEDENYFKADEAEKVSLGSGFVINNQGYIITNNHVIDKAKEISVTFSDDTQLQAKLIGADAKTDIALIKVETKNVLYPVKLGDSEKIRVGDWILAIGNPFGLGGSVTAGIVSAKSRDIESGPYDNFIQTDASINQGSSGGPMFNMNGEVIGINTAIFSTSGGNMGIGFAVPINLTNFIIDELIKKGKVERGWIGLKIKQNSKGIVVSSVSIDSPAKKTGIEAGDIITKLNNSKVNNSKDFSRMIAETKIGKTVELMILRDEKFMKKIVAVELMVEDETVQEEKKEAITTSGLDASLGFEVENIENKDGVVITNIIDGSDAQQKGLKVGNLITEVDKKMVFDKSDFLTFIKDAKLENNRPVLFLINNNNLFHYVSIKLKNHE